MTFEEYLKNDPIPNVEFLIEKDHIRISTLNSTFVELSRAERHEKDEFIARIKDIKAVAKAKGVKVSDSRKALRMLNECWDAYKNQIDWDDKIFDGLKPYIEDVKRRGLNYGCGAYDIDLHNIQYNASLLKECRQNPCDTLYVLNCLWELLKYSRESLDRLNLPYEVRLS